MAYISKEFLSVDRGWPDGFGMVCNLVKEAMDE